jgi:hypothetical protein
MISTSFICSFVLAQESSNDDGIKNPPKAEETIANFIDVLISYIVPLLIYMTIDYEYDKSAGDVEDVDSRTGNLIYSFIFFMQIGLQEEIAFTITTVEIAYYIKFLQHIVSFNFYNIF